MVSVTVIGSGNVAEAFAIALSQCGVLCEVVGRNEQRLGVIAEVTGCRVTSFDDMSAADLYILAVSDSAVMDVARSVEFPHSSIVVHCAGSVALSEPLDGVIYPMQSFTAGRRVNFKEVPLFIEGESGIIEDVARMLSDRVISLDSQGRSQLHLAAVFACNFTNAMLGISYDLLSSKGVDFDLYRPLVEESVAKAFDSSPRQAQTGAARRGDIETQSRHLKMLEGMEGMDDLSEIYKIISRYIWEISKRI